MEIVSPDEFKLIGTPVKRLDVAGKVNGTAIYGIDARRCHPLATKILSGASACRVSAADIGEADVDSARSTVLFGNFADLIVASALNLTTLLRRISEGGNCLDLNRRRRDETAKAWRQGQNFCRSALIT